MGPGRPTKYPKTHGGFGERSPPRATPYPRRSPSPPQHSYTPPIDVPGLQSPGSDRPSFPSSALRTPLSRPQDRPSRAESIPALNPRDFQQPVPGPSITRDSQASMAPQSTQFWPRGGVPAVGGILASRDHLHGGGDARNYSPGHGEDREHAVRLTQPMPNPPLERPTSTDSEMFSGLQDSQLDNVMEEFEQAQHRLSLVDDREMNSPPPVDYRELNSPPPVDDGEMNSPPSEGDAEPSESRFSLTHPSVADSDPGIEQWLRDQSEGDDENSHFSGGVDENGDKDEDMSHISTPSYWIVTNEGRHRRQFVKKVAFEELSPSDQQLISSLDDANISGESDGESMDEDEDGDDDASCEVGIADAFRPHKQLMDDIDPKTMWVVRCSAPDSSNRSSKARQPESYTKTLDRLPTGDLRHSIGNNASLQDGITRLPFSIFSCTHLLKQLKALEAAIGPMPSEEEVKECLKNLAKFHPVLMRECRYRESEPQPRPKQKRKSGPNSEAGTATEASDEEPDDEEEGEESMPFWDSPPRQQYYSLPFPVTAPIPGRRSSAEATRKRYEDDWKRWLREHPHVQRDAIHVDAAVPDDIEDVDPTSVPCGVPATAIPPWVCSKLKVLFAPYLRYVKLVFLNLAAKRQCSVGGMPYPTRDRNATLPPWESSLVMDAAWILYGPAAIDHDEGGGRSWAHYSPDEEAGWMDKVLGGPAYTALPSGERRRAHRAHYQQQVKESATTFATYFYTQEKQLYKRVKDLDLEVEKKWFKLYVDQTPIGDPVPVADDDDGTAVHYDDEFNHHLTSEERTLLLNHAHQFALFGAPMAPWFDELVVDVQQKLGAEQDDGVATQPPSSSDSPPREPVSPASSRRSSTAPLSLSLNSEAGGGASSSTRPAASYNDSLHVAQQRCAEVTTTGSLIPDDIDEATLTQISIPRDFGVGKYRHDDAYSLMCLLGLRNWLSPATRKAAEQYSPEAAHKWHVVDGRVVYLNPKAHAARSHLPFPYTQAVIQNGVRLYPKAHQLAALCAMVEQRGTKEYGGSSDWTTLLSDETGLGKTWIPILEMALSFHYRVERDHNPNFCPPILTPPRPQSLDDGREVWPQMLVGEVRRSLVSRPLDRRRRHVFISTKSIISAHDFEARRLLDPKYFVVCNLDETFRDGDGNLVQEFVSKEDKEDLTTIDRNQRRRYPELNLEQYEVLFLATASTLTAHAKRTTTETASVMFDAKSSLFSPLLHFDSLFVDEVVDFKNPSTQKAAALRRISEKANVVTAATATPIENRITDLINICRLIGMPRVVDRVKLAGGRFGFISYITDTSSGVILPEMQGPQVTRWFHDCTSEIQALVQTHDDLYRESRQNRKDYIRHLEELDERGEDIDLQWRTLPDKISWVLKKRIEHSNGDMLSRVIQPLIKMLDGVMIRRTSQSTGHAGQPLTEIQTVQPEVVWVSLPRHEQALYDKHYDDSASEDAGFLVNTRRLLRFGYTFVKRGYHIMGRKSCPAVLSQLGKNLASWQRVQQGKGDDSEREKAIIAVNWVDGLPIVLAELARFGVYAMVITGRDSAESRFHKVRQFQQDEDHMSEPFTYFASPKLRVDHPSVCCRILIISDVGSYGITLTRANVLEVFDPLWAYAKTEQRIGRINRIGQTRPVRVNSYFALKTIERSLFVTAQTKLWHSSLYLGEGNDAGHQGPVADTTPDQDVEELSQELGTVQLRPVLHDDDNVKRQSKRRGRLLRKALAQYIRPSSNNPTPLFVRDKGKSVARSQEEIDTIDDINLNMRQVKDILGKVRAIVGRLQLQQTHGRDFVGCVKARDWESADKVLCIVRCSRLLAVHTSNSIPYDNAARHFDLRILWTLFNVRHEAIRFSLVEILASIVCDSGQIMPGGLAVFPGRVLLPYLAPTTLAEIARRPELLSPDPPYLGDIHLPRSHSRLFTLVRVLAAQADSHCLAAAELDPVWKATKVIDRLRLLVKRTLVSAMPSRHGPLPRTFEKESRLLETIRAHFPSNFFFPEMALAVRATNIDATGKIQPDLVDNPATISGMQRSFTIRGRLLEGVSFILPPGWGEDDEGEEEGEES